RIHRAVVKNGKAHSDISEFIDSHTGAPAVAVIGSIGSFLMNPPRISVGILPELIPADSCVFCCRTIHIYHKVEYNRIMGRKSTIGSHIHDGSVQSIHIESLSRLRKVHKGSAIKGGDKRRYSFPTSEFLGFVNGRFCCIFAVYIDKPYLEMIIIHPHPGIILEINDGGISLWRHFISNNRET